MFSILRNLNAFLLCIVTVFFTLFLNHIILYIFPEIKFYQYAILFLVYLFLIFAITYKKRQEIINNKIIIKKGEDEYFMYKMPNILNYRYTFFICFFTIFVGLLSFSSNKSTLIIDNGYDENLEILINQKEKIIVPSKSHKEINVFHGDINLYYNNKSHHFKIDNQNYILNPDSKNTYVSTYNLYTNKDLKEIPSEYNDSVKIIKSEFFINDFYFVFEKPDEEILSDNKKEYSIKKALFRVQK